MRRMPKARRSPRVPCGYRIHATSARMNATRARAHPIPDRMRLALETVHAIRRGMSLAQRTVNATADRAHAGLRRMIPGWRTDDSIGGRIRAAGVGGAP
jgi:hypothetical protein